MPDHFTSFRSLKGIVYQFFSIHMFKDNIFWYPIPLHAIAPAMSRKTPIYFIIGTFLLDNPSELSPVGN